MDVRALLHNKWALGGVAAAAGLYVFLRKRKAAASSSPAGGSSTVAASPGYTSAGIGGFDSTGTDVASWLGSEQGFIDNQFTQFGQSLSDQLAKIPTQSTTGTSSTPAVPTTTTTAPPTVAQNTPAPPKAAASSTERFVWATKYPSPLGTLSGIAAANKTSVAALMKLNPGIKDANLIFPNEKIRVA